MSVTGTTLRVSDSVATLSAFAGSMMALLAWGQFALAGFGGPRPMAEALAWTAVALVLWTLVVGIEKLQTRLGDADGA